MLLYDSNKQLHIENKEPYTYILKRTLSVSYYNPNWDFRYYVFPNIDYFILSHDLAPVAVGFGQMFLHELHSVYQLLHDSCYKIGWQESLCWMANKLSKTNIVILLQTIDPVLE